MCTTCGCGGSEARIESSMAQAGRGQVHTHADGTVHSHEHGQVGHQHHAHQHDPHAASDAAGVAAAGSRRLSIEQDILARNDSLAAANRRWLGGRGIFAVNLVSSPGSGKTTLLEKTIAALSGSVEVGVIEGDQQTSHDADRIRATGARAIQINTGKGCHLDADMVAQAMARLDPAAGSVLMIENVGNLVCPAAFDLGEAHKVVVLSVTEGEDKPLKYPDMFRRATVMLLNKTDLLPHVDFDVARCIAYARRVNPHILVMPVSARSGEGLAQWTDWLRSGWEAARAGAVVAGGQVWTAEVPRA